MNTGRKSLCYGGKSAKRAKLARDNAKDLSLIEVRYLVAVDNDILSSVFTNFFMICNNDVAVLQFWLTGAAAITSGD